MPDLKYEIHPLDKTYKKAIFSCGIDALDGYLQTQAGQDARRGVTATYVLTAAKSKLIAGYYMLSATSIALNALPEEIVKKLPRYPTLPATLLGRLAIDKKYTKQGLGELLLIDALKRSLNASKQIGAMAVIVDPKDDHATQFYLHYGFMRFPKRKDRLFSPGASL